MKLHARPRTGRGFTLMEVAVAMVIVGITAIAAISLYAAVIRAFHDSRALGALTTRMFAGVDYITRGLRGAAGNGIPVSAGVFIENRAETPRGEFPDGADPTLQSSVGDAGFADRLVTFTAVADVPQCTITNAFDESGTPSTGTVGQNVGTLRFDVDGGCCYNTGSGAGGRFIRTAMLVSGVYSRPVLLTNDSMSDCLFRWEDIAPATMRSLPEDTNALMADAFGAGASVLVDMRAFYVDPGTHELILHLDVDDGDGRDLNGYGLTPTLTGERVLLLDGVFDMQYSLGFEVSALQKAVEALDAIPEVEGGLTAGESIFYHDLIASSHVDDDGIYWLYNGPLDPFDEDDEQAANVQRMFRQLGVPLSMVRIETVVGVTTNAAGDKSRVAAPMRTAGLLFSDTHTLRSSGTALSPRASVDTALNLSAFRLLHPH